MSELDSGRVSQYMWRKWDLSKGDWNYVAGFRHFTLDATGVVGAITLYGSNSRLTPDPHTGGHIIGQNIMMDGLTEILLPVTYLRAEVSDDSEPTLILMGVE